MPSSGASISSSLMPRIRKLPRRPTMASALADPVSVRRASPSEWEKAARRALRSSNTSMPRACQRSGIDDVHSIREGLFQDAFQYGVLYQVRIEFRQPAIVADADLADPLAGDLRQESAQVFAKLKVRFKLLIL